MTCPRFVRTLLAVAVAGFVFASVDAQGPPDLEARHQRLLPLLELDGVVFTDADETRGRFVVGVLNRGLETSVRARLSALGIPSESVDVIQTEAIVQVATLRDHLRPVVGGLQIRFSQYLCSLGFNAERNGIAGYVTAAHCSTKQGEVDATAYYQPQNQVAEEFIGTETADPAFSRGNGCPRGRKCRYSDANFSDGIDVIGSFALGEIAKTTGANNGSLDIDGALRFRIKAEEAASLGQIANKVGRTTGWSQGAVSRTCVNTGVLGTNILLLCQNFVDASVGSGDSGSPVFRIDGGDDTVILLGVLWGGNSSGTQFVYSPIANVERELGALATCAVGYGGPGCF